METEYKEYGDGRNDGCASEYMSWTPFTPIGMRNGAHSMEL